LLKTKSKFVSIIEPFIDLLAYL